MKDREDTAEAGHLGTRQRILEAAYSLFITHGTKSVGVDTISAASRVAKMTLYHHFASKEALVVAFLKMREQRWTCDWLKAGVTRGHKDAKARLLAVFALYDAWFRSPDFEGCPFVRLLCEAARGSLTHKAAVRQRAKILAFIVELARAAGLADPETLAHAWTMLMDGAILGAQAGQRDAAVKAGRAAAVLLEAWPRPAKARLPKTPRVKARRASVAKPATKPRTKPRRRGT